VPDPQDIVDIPGIATSKPAAPDPARGAAGERPGPAVPFLMIWFRCCHAYGRLYKDRDGTRYHGRCPKCLASCEVPVGDGGTSRRIFEAS
jgi:hypothetical protein